MSRTSLQYQIINQGGAINTVSVPYPTPGPNEICIRPRAVALNPLDWKRRAFGFMVESWPTVLGIDAAGIVDSVGKSVTHFRKGDEVFNLCGLNNRGGAFQEIITVPSHYVAMKPDNLTVEEASSLPICYLTAATAITLGLHVCLPHLDPDSSGNSSSLRSILVLGGSSGIGAIAIQLLRLALPSATILTTSSAKHHTHLISLGASKCFERCAQGNTADIKIATPGGLGVDAILDTVQAAAGQQAVFTSLSLSGPMLYSQVRTGMTVEVPEGINSTEIDGRQILGTEGGENALPALASLIQSGRFKLPNKVEIVGNGPTGIQQGLDKLMKGVSGAKYIVAFVAV